MRKGRHITEKILSLVLAAAMCCLAACGEAGIPTAERSDTSSEEASSSLTPEAPTPEEYFQNASVPEEENRSGMIRDICETFTPGERFFSTKQEELEDTAVIPVLKGDYSFTCGALYGEEEELKELLFHWKLITMVPGGYGEDDLIVSVAEAPDRFPGVDEYASHFGMAATWQEGVEITAVGAAETEKSLTFPLEERWYRIYGSERIPVEDVLAVLEHFLHHPIDPEPFAKENGDEYTWSELPEYPDAFAGYYPVDSALCPALIPTASEVRLQNGVPVMAFFDYDTVSSGHAIGGWYIYRENPDYMPDPLERSNFAGDISTLTEQDLKDFWQKGIVLFQHEFPFTWDGYLIVAQMSENATPEQMWQLLQELQERKAQAEK